MGTVTSTPVVLSSSATYSFAAGVPNAPFVPLSITNFVNSLAVPVEITEFNFEVHTVQTAGVFGRDARMSGGVEVDLRIGRYGITNGFVPFAPLGIRRDTATTEIGGAISPLGALSIGTRWILPKPLIVGPQESFSGFARASPSVPIDATAEGPVTVTIAARGRRYDGPMPRSRIVPYASGGFFTPDMSLLPTRTFGNIFRVPLNVSSINGYKVSHAGSLLFLGATASIVGPGGLSNAVRRQVVDRTTFNVMFNERLAIEEDTVLLPDEFYQINGYLGPNDATVGARPAIVMIGYREEA